MASVECPLFQTKTVRHLMKSPGEAKFLTCGGRRGYPFLLPSAPLLKVPPEGEEYLRKYMLLEQRVQDYAGKEFKKLFLQEECPAPGSRPYNIVT